MSWGFSWWGQEYRRKPGFRLHLRDWPGPCRQPIGFTISLGWFHCYLMIWT